MAYSYDIKLANIILSTADESRIVGQTALGSTDDAAVCVKALQSEITDNSSNLQISLNQKIDKDKLSFFHDATDNAEESIEFVYSTDGWKVDDTVVTLSDYGIGVKGTPKTGDTFTVKYKFHTITKIVYVDENENAITVTRRLYKVSGSNYLVQGPLTCSKGADFNLFTKMNVPFSIKATIMTTNFFASGSIMKRYVSSNDWWDFHLVAGYPVFTLVAAGTKQSYSWFLRKHISANTFHTISFFCSSPTDGTFGLMVDGIVDNRPVTIPISAQRTVPNQCEVIAGADGNIWFYDAFQITGVRHDSVGKARIATIPITEGTFFYSDEDYE